MAIMVRCRCGKSLRARDSSAGKRVKCSACGGPVPVPAANVYDDFGDDDTGGDLYGSPPPRRSARKKKKTKPTSPGFPVPLMIGGGLLAAVVVIVGLYMAFSGGGENKLGDAANVAETSPADTDTADGETHNPAANAAPDAANAAGQPVAAAHQTSGSTPQSAAVTSAPDSAVATAAPPAEAANPPPSTGGDATPETMWVVLSDFKQQQGAGGINKTLNVNYRVVSGQPQTSRQYVLFVGNAMGMMTRYQEVELDLKNANGTVAVPVSMTFNRPTAYVAWKKGPRDWEPVSGEISVGGQPTDARRPPSIQEAAGPDAQGKLLALANARFEKSRVGQQALVVDFVLQSAFDPGFQYVLVVQGQGEPMRVRVSTSLMRAKQGEKDQFGVRPLGGQFPAGDLTVHVEKRRSSFGSETPEVVSNSARVQR